MVSLDSLSENLSFVLNIEQGVVSFSIQEQSDKLTQTELKFAK